jgi:hypothetical protein
MNNPWLRFAMIVAAWDDLLRADISVLRARIKLKLAERRQRRLMRDLERMTRRIQADPEFQRLVQSKTDDQHPSP